MPLILLLTLHVILSILMIALNLLKWLAAELTCRVVCLLTSLVLLLLSTINDLIILVHNLTCLCILRWCWILHVVLNLRLAYKLLLLSVHFKKLESCWCGLAIALILTLVSMSSLNGVMMLGWISNIFHGCCLINRAILHLTVYRIIFILSLLQCLILQCGVFSHTYRSLNPFVYQIYLLFKIWFCGPLAISLHIYLD